MIGNRIPNETSDKSITIFLMTFVFPATTGYLIRMQLLLNWANQSFEKVNLIIPTNDFAISATVLNSHIMVCDNLFLVSNQRRNNLFFKLRKLGYKLFTGHYPPFHSNLFLSNAVIQDFKNVILNDTTDYFLNTRNNYAGLAKFVPNRTVKIIDTQDIFTELYRKYSLNNKSTIIRKILEGYKEHGPFYKSEIMALSDYDKIIAISDTDYRKYKLLEEIKGKVEKIESVGFNIVDIATSTKSDKSIDVLIVASDFVATRRGIDWFINEVCSFLTFKINISIIGTIGGYLKDRKWNESMLELKILGVVKSLDDYYNKSKIIVLPMTEATGTSVKGLEALSYGAAIVSTSSGVRFGGLESGKELLITDNAQKFAKNIEYLIENENERCQLGKNALNYARKKFSPRGAYRKLDKTFELN